MVKQELIVVAAADVVVAGLKEPTSQKAPYLPEQRWPLDKVGLGYRVADPQA
jgi:hypothetical protein